MLPSHLALLITQLKSISPLPDDDTLNDLPGGPNHLLELYWNIIQALEQEIQVEYPLELISPLLESFGIGDGNEVFGHMAHLIEGYPNPQELYPLIQQATRSSNAGTRKWSCDILGKRRKKEDEPFFIERLGDEEGEVRSMALLGLCRMAQQYDMSHLLSMVDPFLNDPYERVRSYARMTLEQLQKQKKNKV